MLALVITTFVLFLGFGWLAFMRRDAKIWSFVDLVYYPLSAVGVLLLFASSAADRRMISLRNQQSAVQTALARTEQQKPELRAESSAALLDASLGILQPMVELGDVCEKTLFFDATCDVARKTGPILRDYLSSIPAGHEGDDSNAATARLAQACIRATGMLQRLRDSQAMSGLVADQLLSHYAEGLQKGFFQGAYDQATQYVETFPKRVSGSIDQLQPYIVSGVDAKIGQYVIDVYRQEANQGKSILSALIPCLWVPVKPLEDWTRWVKDRTALEVDLAKANEHVKELRDKGDPSQQWISEWRLLWWPYLIISALAIKFGKGVAHTADPLEKKFKWALGALRTFRSRVFRRRSRA